MKRVFSNFLSFSTVCLLSGCLSVPHPFENRGKGGNGGIATAPTSRLDVPVPSDSALTPEGDKLWASQVTQALLDQSVPAITQPVRRGDWWLRLHTERRGDMIVPLYSVMTPQGEVRATQEGPAVPASSWAMTSPEVLRDASQQGAGQVVSILTGIMAQDMEEDPHSLKHRGARIWFQGVTGAPGDGDVSLARAFTVMFREMKDTIQTSGSDADFVVHTTVHMTDGPPGTRNHPQQNIRIEWRVTDKAGNEVGIATQLHEIPAHSLDGMWGDIAVAAAGEAAGAVEEMITRYSSRDAKPLPDAAKSAAKNKKK
ncbi:hypothetical protein [Acetobacter conturbans]|uniref:Lipoprotein n=1 Tax=Acetobacter conturbans TaxID=1737472 RepID=A0ABX0K0Q6_9PROT|nr:hypothetical protein [Acetobacter conturbans]NHN87888.1 hypothetical protein [Acetobacter conturbans]